MLQFAQYVLAKYVLDPERFESRNIGVFVWRPGAIECRFLPARDAAKFVADVEVYSYWVRYWEEKIAEPEFRYKDTLCPKSSSQYLDALLLTQKPHYRLLLGREMVSLQGENLTEALDGLYKQLVLPRPRQSVEAPPSGILSVGRETPSRLAETVILTNQQTEPVSKAAALWS